MDEVKRYEDIDSETFKYVPMACVTHKVDVKDAEGKPTGEKKTVEPTFSGHVVLKKIGLLRRLELTPQIEGLKSADKHGIGAIAFAIKNTMDLFVTCDLTHLASGKKFTDLAAMLTDSKCDAIVIEIALQHLEGFSSTNGEPLGN